MKGVHVDIMCTYNGNPVWFIVSDRNQKHVLWYATSKSKGLGERVKQLVDVAHSCSTLKPSSIIFFFASGINHEVHKKLEEEYKALEISVEFPYFDCSLLDEVESGWVTVVGRSFHSATALEIKVDHLRNESLKVDSTHPGSVSTDCFYSLKKDTVRLNCGDSFSRLLSSMKMPQVTFQGPEPSKPGDVLHMKFINFDTTALIAIVSGISNGGSEKLLSMPQETLKQRFKSNYDFVLEQVQHTFINPYYTISSNFLNITRCMLDARVVITSALVCLEA